MTFSYLFSATYSQQFITSENAEEGNKQMLSTQSTANILCHITDCKGSYKGIPWRLLVYRPIILCKANSWNFNSHPSVFSVSLRRYDTFLQRSALTLSFCHHSSSQSSSVNPSNVTQPFSEDKAWCSFGLESNMYFSHAGKGLKSYVNSPLILPF